MRKYLIGCGCYFLIGFAATWAALSYLHLQDDRDSWRRNCLKSMTDAQWLEKELEKCKNGK